jgi:hypothetical protein
MFFQCAFFRCSFNVLSIFFQSSFDVHSFDVHSFDVHSFGVLFSPTSMGTTPSAPRSMHVQRWSSTKTSATQLKISWQEVTSAKLQVSAYLLYWRYVKSVLMVS